MRRRLIRSVSGTRREGFKLAGMIFRREPELRQSGYTLTVEFTSGRIYDHPGVPPSVYQEFMNASSMGWYYSKFIRGRYK